MKIITPLTKGRKSILMIFKNNKIITKALFIITGLSATLWFLIRVIPKPTRASYPCIQAATPVMSAFVIYILSLVSGITAWRFAKIQIKQRKFIIAGSLLFVCIGSCIVFIATPSFQSLAIAPNQLKSLTIAPNQPIGTPTGYFAGRVVWVYDADATDENCTNGYDGDFWYQKTNQTVVDRMLADGFKAYSEKPTVAEAWDAMFKHFNQKNEKGWKGYTSGEKICIKINLTNTSTTGYETGANMDATPQLCLALLRQLVDSIGVAEEDITIGDPFRTFSDAQFDACYSEYPNVHYIDGYVGNGREQTKISNSEFYSTSDGGFSSRIPQAYVDATYLINMPCLKSHDAAGVTITAKNHQGSVLGTGQDATNQGMGADLHYCFPASDGEYKNPGQYRHLVDYMGNKYMGVKTLVFITDALWSGHNWYGDVHKWQMAPFNNDYTSSLFITQDQVAMECVGFDFLHDEYMNHSDAHDYQQLPLMNDDNGSVQDYALQAASKDYWPAGIIYEDGSGKEIKSLGVFEHWNSYTTMQYSVNLTGNKGGIHLVSVPKNLVPSVDLNYGPDTSKTTTIYQNETVVSQLNIYPNPVNEILNIEYQLISKGLVNIDIYDSKGTFIKRLQSNSQTEGTKNISVNISELGLSNGLYFCNLQIDNKLNKSLKFNVIK